MSRLKKALEDLGVPNEQQARRNRAWAVPILGLVALFVLTRPVPPKPEAVSEVYRNPCCNPVTIRNGLLISDAGRFTFKLHLMKYDLEAQIDVHLIVQGGKVVRSARPPDFAVLFNEPRTSFVLCARVCGAGNEYEFSPTQPTHS